MFNLQASRLASSGARTNGGGGDLLFGGHGTPMTPPMPTGSPQPAGASASVAAGFQRELIALQTQTHSLSREQMNQIVSVAIAEIRHYKHVVYYVESFIKNVS